MHPFQIVKVLNSVVDFGSHALIGLKSGRELAFYLIESFEASPDYQLEITSDEGVFFLSAESIEYIRVEK